LRVDLHIGREHADDVLAKAQAAVGKINELAATEGGPKFVVVTGDLTESGSQS